MRSLLPVPSLCVLLFVLFLAGRGVWLHDCGGQARGRDGRHVAAAPLAPAPGPGPGATGPSEGGIPADAAPVSVEPVAGFSPAMQQLVTAADAGVLFHFSAPGLAPQEVLLRPSLLLAPGFRLSIGAGAPAQPQNAFAPGLRIYEGRAFGGQNSSAPAQVSLAIAGSAMFMDMIAADGSRLSLSGADPEHLRLTLAAGASAAGMRCVIDQLAGRATLRSESVRPAGVADAGIAARGKLRPALEVLELSGTDPATGKLDRFVEPIPMAEQYALSLKDMLLLFVLDKDATGEGTDENLSAKTSQTLARLANVATIYENQLGLRLLLQELVMVPDSAEYADVPHLDPLVDFRQWCQDYRNSSRFGWTCAMKEGAGLRDFGTLGIANVGRVNGRDAVSVVQTNVDYLVIAHEMAHNLGSAHTDGGIMNARAISNHERNFFTDISGKDGETAAKDIFDYVEPRLRGNASMRHPEEMPFAESDFVRFAGGGPVTIPVLENDRDHVRHGVVNSVLSVIETSRVLPEGAGEARALADGSAVEFRPADGFAGTAWFSYTMRGNVGNDSQGWMHKGDVAVDVPADGGGSADVLTLRLRPGASYSFFPRGGVRTWTEAGQARIFRSEDDRNLLILRVGAEATGTDTFEVGADHYAIEYTDAPPVAAPDTVWIDRYRSAEWISPLTNDAGAGWLWLQEISPAVGVGSPEAGRSGRHFFPTSMMLTGAENLDPRLGRISLETLPVTVDGEVIQALTGRIHYVPEAGADGVGAIRYTVRDASGREASGRITVLVDNGYDTLVFPDDEAAVVVPVAETADALAGWTMPGFDDADWKVGPMGIGYENNTGYEAWIGTDVGDAVWNTAPGVYIRIPFEVPATAGYSSLGFRARYDDGFVVYLNGRQVLARNAPSDPTWQSLATASDEQAADGHFHVADLSAHRDLLRTGMNTLAIHLMNDEVASSDLLMQPVLVAYPSPPPLPPPPPLSPFAARFLEWRGDFLPGADPVPAEEDALHALDSDRDGFADVVEFLAESSPVDPADLPGLALTFKSAGVRQTVTLAFLRRRDAADLGAAYQLEQSVAPGDGFDWELIELESLHDAGGSVTSSPWSDAVEVVQVRIPFDGRDAAQRYFRLRFDVPEP